MSYSVIGCEYHINESQYGTPIEMKRNFTYLYVRLLWKVLKIYSSVVSYWKYGKVAEFLDSWEKKIWKYSERSVVRVKAKEI